MLSSIASNWIHDTQSKYHWWYLFNTRALCKRNLHKLFIKVHELFVMYIKNMWNALMSMINNKQFHEKFNELTCEAVHKPHTNLIVSHKPLH